ncbi:AAA family ATPase [Actinosynnema sp. NPDC050436]|uniref:AAA family ATPase n=1 Tax=Actinosynnema sp. NPDC050436 TaxID=3155659 RepID=UPI0033FC82CB
MDAVRTALGSGTPLVSVTGPTGIGRTAFLAALADDLARRGTRVTTIRFTRDGDPVPSGGSGTDAVRAVVGPVVGAHRYPEVARRAAASAGSDLLRGTGPAVVLVDDAQWLDRDSRAVLEALARRLAGTSAGCVCAVRTPMPGEDAAWWRGLRAAGLLHPVRLRPMTGAQVAGLLAAETGAVPDAGLVDHVLVLTRGVPAAVRDAVAALRRGRSLSVVAGRAHLAPGVGRCAPARDNEFVRAITALGPQAHAVARAVSVLAPLGAAVPGLVAEALCVTANEAARLLGVLLRAGVLHRGRRGETWRFPVPLVAAALVAGMGPFERRRLAACAVDAVWTGGARCADPDHLADLVADAGRLVDPARAFDALLSRVAQAGGQPHPHVPRWLDAAVDLADDRAQRVAALRAQVAAHRTQGDHAAVLRGARTLLDDFADELAPDASHELQVIAVDAVRSLGDVDALRDIAEHRRSWTDHAAQNAVTRAYALSAADRWAEARDLLESDGTWRHADDPASARSGDLLLATAALWTGRPDRFERSLAERDRWPGRDVPRRLLEQVDAHVSALLVTGDLRRAEHLPAVEGVEVARLRTSGRALVAALRGDVDHAVELAWRGVARRDCDPASAAMCQAVVALLVARAQPAGARALLTAARDAGLRPAHLLDLAEAQLDLALGHDDRATVALDRALRAVDERQVLVGAELCWSELADVALRAGDRDGARRCLAEVESLAETLPTSRVLLHADLLRAVVEGDREAAGRCLHLVRDRDQPGELAAVSERLVRHGVGDPASLTEVYHVLGGLDALLHRSWLRNLMRDNGIAVPGRWETVAENERVLAALAADGLSNKQLALALRTSEKSVEGRLSRLFAHSGYRSRIELSTAVLTGGQVRDGGAGDVGRGRRNGAAGE